MDQQSCSEQPGDDHHISGDEQPHDEQPGDEESTSFIDLADSTSGSSDVKYTHTSIVEDDVTKNFWDRLAGIFKNLELLNM